MTGGSFGGDSYDVLVCGGEVEEVIGGLRDKLVAVLVKGADEIFNLKGMLVIVFVIQ